MEAEDIDNFTKKMLTEKVFLCAICHNLLTAPITIVEDVGNVCHKCFQTEENSHEWKSVPNAHLNTILKELKFPCKFESKGCESKIIYGDLKNHEAQCIYRAINCLMSKNVCEWTGRLIDLAEHFKKDHPNHVLSGGPCNEFSFEINSAQTVDIFKLIINKDKVLILKIAEMEENNKTFLSHFVYTVSPSNDNLQTILKYVGQNNHFNLKVKRVPLPANCDLNSGKKIRLSTMKDIAEPGENIKIVVKAEKHEPKTVSGEVLKQLTCPVCAELMRPPIYLCLSGHNLCFSCREKVTSCPICRQSKSDVRNYALEGLVSVVTYPCTYSKFGCEKTFLGDEVSKHEGLCGYKMYTCPITNCHFSGTYTLCRKHFECNHMNQMVQTTCHVGTFTPLGNGCSPTKEELYFFQHGNIYGLTFQRSGDSCSWDIQILNVADENVKYFYTVTVTDAKMPQRKISKSILCSKADDKRKQRITFEYNELASYKNSSNDQINYYCEMFEQRCI